MKIKQFDVVKLKDKNKAIILNKLRYTYWGEIVDLNGRTKEKRNIHKNEIANVIYSRNYKQTL